MGGSCIIVATDLDGTLLDAESYAYDPAISALRELAGAGVRTVFCSSKTAAEIEALQAALGMQEGFVAENGAVLSDGVAGHPPILRGRPVDAVDAALAALRNAHDFPCQWFGEMTVARICELTGLTPEDAALARKRLCTEPVWWPPDCGQQRARWRELLAADGWQTLRGGRFETVGSAMDKAEGLAALLEIWGIERSQCRIVAAGDSENDRTLLQAADDAIVFPARDGRYLKLKRPHRRAPAAGPSCWAREIGELLMPILESRASMRRPE